MMGGYFEVAAPLAEVTHEVTDCEERSVHSGSGSEPNGRALRRPETPAITKPTELETVAARGLRRRGARHIVQGMAKGRAGLGERRARAGRVD
jgi:hypothetical protein